ncbi:anaphase-promoting complex, cyclosome, subunit 4-domain-containing protein [Durotheca rogersii]|uniref:anaphase-promoting complex, cyclosome, subunit 4-domain-containing protein n=1 Tax=Durotheca rogersii TaxID=419775 RepID=UPI00221FE431|nr:anaphase-promoting complex, cyclosome, subunit 4-domain-containing protein [Durotheca rogersii]KAI5859345.1 anaphase-promoting complex, cyclosome, subunit 4-domain-containing protein [Durotheca rogersii]
MVVLAASICTRGGKAVLSRQFREMPRSRIEALLASFPKLADSGTQHTTVEQDNVRFVYQPLDELYMVLITNRQSNILQDIDSLHLFAQVVTSTCRSLDEREILKNAYELLSAFDELVSLGYRENLTISQIKTFLEMESHEERIQEIIARNKELEATEERKRKAKQLELQRKESARSGRPGVPRTPVYPTYTPPTRPTPADTYDSYEAEKNKSAHKTTIMKGKGMQLGKKSKTTDMFERVRGDMGAEVDDSPLVQPTPAPAAEPSAPRVSSTLDRDAIHVTINESISAKLSREGSVNSLAITGDLTLRISDPSLTKIKLNLAANASHGAQFRTHPNVDRGLFASSKVIQMSNVARGFPVNNAVGVLRWRATPKTDDTSALPISFTVWVNKGSTGNFTITVEYELTGGDGLKDVSVVIPYATSEPTVSSFDAIYEVSGDSLEWTIGTIDEDNASGSFEFDAEADDENEFFPMQVRFSKTTPFVDVEVASVLLVEENEEVTFSKDIKSVADSYLVEYESRLDPPPHDGLLTYNPSIELFAGAAGPASLQIWRSNGQVVTKISQRGERDTVDALRWKADGQFLAVAWSDGIVRLMGLETNKAVHQIPVCAPGKSKITCIGWARNNAGKRPNPPTTSSTTFWEDALARELFPGGRKTTIDLPRELTFLEVETALPKLGPLPASGGSGDDMFVFTTRASLEFLFQPFSPQDSDKVDVMLIGTDDGQVHVSIYDSFVIGSFKCALPLSFGKDTVAIQLLHHTSHPDLSTHVLAFKPSGQDKSTSLYLVPMDLTFVYSSPVNLSLLASKTTTLQKLLRYVKQVQMHMMHEWQSTRELPTRFLNSINETLRESNKYGEMTIGQAMYHSVVTGHTFPEVQEWLVDQLAERGHRRWDKAVVSGLQALRSLVHENFLPALERIGIILSRLLGIARFHESKAEIGFSSAQITRIMGIVSCLMLVGNKILLFVMEELELFQCFSTWLRHEIDRLASSSSSSDELSEKEATMEHGKILAYIQQYLAASPLRFHLDAIAANHSEKGRQQAESGSALLELLTKQLKKQESGQPDESVFSQIEFLCGYLRDKAEAIFNGIAEAEKRSSIYVFRTSMDVLNGISGPVTTDATSIVLGGGKVVDLKFLYDSLLVLWLSPDRQQLRLIRVPHKSEDLGYRAYSRGNEPVDASAERVTPVHVLSDEQVASAFANAVVPPEPGFTPAQMEVREASSERGKLPARICLLGADARTYRVFALPEDGPFGEAATS